jgi:hypothetical protein
VNEEGRKTKLFLSEKCGQKGFAKKTKLFGTAVRNTRKGPGHDALLRQSDGWQEIIDDKIRKKKTCHPVPHSANSRLEITGTEV